MDLIIWIVFWSKIEVYRDQGCACWTSARNPAIKISAHAEVLRSILLVTENVKITGAQKVGKIEVIYIFLLYCTLISNWSKFNPFRSQIGVHTPKSWLVKYLWGLNDLKRTFRSCLERFRPISCSRPLPIPRNKFL